MRIRGIPVACIDIGSNTTRLLVVEASGGSLTELAVERVFTRIGASLTAGRIPPAKTAETAAVVDQQAAIARRLGAARIEVVATAAIREAGNAGELAEAVKRTCGLKLRVLQPEEEARLAFAGATATLPVPADGPLAVIDVGGGSTEIAVGSPGAGMTWSTSLRLGSSLLGSVHLRGDPPAAAELEALRADVRRALDRVELPPVRTALAVGGSATSLQRIAGGRLEPAWLARALAAVTSAPAAEVAEALSLAPERVRLLPGGIVVLDELAQRLGITPAVARGGLREGVVLDLLAG